MKTLTRSSLIVVVVHSFYNVSPLHGSNRIALKRGLSRSRRPCFVFVVVREPHAVILYYCRCGARPGETGSFQEFASRPFPFSRIFTLLPTRSPASFPILPQCEGSTASKQPRSMYDPRYSPRIVWDRDGPWNENEWTRDAQDALSQNQKYIVVR